MKTAPGYQYPSQAKQIRSSVPVTWDEGALPQSAPADYVTREQLAAEVANVPSRAETQQLVQAEVATSAGTVVVVSDSYQVVPGVGTVIVTAGIYAAATTITLPTAPLAGQDVFVKRDGTMTGTLTVTGAGAHTIEGGSVALSAANDGVLVRYDGAGTWWIVATV